MTKNKIWILSSTELGSEQLGYDCFWGFVIEALTEKRARKLAEEAHGDEEKDFWLDSKYSNCEELKPNGEEGIWLSDFHAG